MDVNNGIRNNYGERSMYNRVVQSRSNTQRRSVAQEYCSAVRGFQVGIDTFSGYLTASLTSMLAEGLTYPKLLLLLFANKLTFISKVAQKGRLDADSKIQSIFFGVMGEIIFYQDKEFINSQTLPKLITAAVTSFGIMSALEVMSFSRNYSQQTVEAVKLASIASIVGGLSGAMAWTAGATSESQVVVTAGLLGAAISGGMSYRKRF